MRLDRFNNPIFNSEDIFNALYRGKTEEIKNLTIEDSPEISNEISNLESVAEFKFNKFVDWPDLVTTQDYDHALQQNWFMPEEYKEMDIVNYIISICPDNNLERAAEEITEFQNRNMLDLLKWLKYFVDTCEKENIVWGVGRGSSVASYVLYLLGVHSIDSVKYNLDWREFLR